MLQFTSQLACCLVIVRGNLLPQLIVFIEVVDLKFFALSRHPSRRCGQRQSHWFETVCALWAEVHNIRDGSFTSGQSTGNV